MEKHHDDVFTFYFIGIVILLISATMTGAILSGNPFQIENLLIPAVFAGVALSFLVGTYLWNIKIGKKITEKFCFSAFYLSLSQFAREICCSLSDV